MVSDGSEVSFSSCYFLMVVNVASACRECFDSYRYDEAAETYKKGLELAPEDLQ